MACVSVCVCMCEFVCMCKFVCTSACVGVRARAFTYHTLPKLPPMAVTHLLRHTIEFVEDLVKRHLQQRRAAEKG